MPKQLSEINQARKIAGLPLVAEATLGSENEPVVQAAAKYVIEMASDKAERANGEVDADGIDDFLGQCVREFGEQVLKAAKALNKD